MNRFPPGNSHFNPNNNIQGYRDNTFRDNAHSQGFVNNYSNYRPPCQTSPRFLHRGPTPYGQIRHQGIPNGPFPNPASPRFQNRPHPGMRPNFDNQHAHQRNDNFTNRGRFNGGMPRPQRQNNDHQHQHMPRHQNGNRMSHMHNAKGGPRNSNNVRTEFLIKL